MIVKKIWTTREDGGSAKWQREGWFLFGFIPLYVRDLTNRSSD
jgi:hypothetical protein